MKEKITVVFPHVGEKGTSKPDEEAQAIPGKSQQRARRSSLAKGLTKSPRRKSEASPLQNISEDEDNLLSAAGILGAGLASDSPLGEKLPRDPGNASTAQVPWSPFLKDYSRYVRPDDSRVSLEVAGQDMQVPPPRPAAKTNTPVLGIAGFTPTLQPCLEDEESVVIEIEQSFHALKKVLECHAIGIPMEITSRRRARKRQARPMFHCARCLAQWQRTGALMTDCKEATDLTPGPTIELSKKAAKYLKKMWKKELAAKHIGMIESQIPAEELKELRQHFKMLICPPEGEGNSAADTDDKIESQVGKSGINVSDKSGKHGTSRRLARKIKKKKKPTPGAGSGSENEAYRSEDSDFSMDLHELTSDYSSSILMGDDGGYRADKKAARHHEESLRKKVHLRGTRGMKKILAKGTDRYSPDEENNLSHSDQDGNDIKTNSRRQRTKLQNRKAGSESQDGMADEYFSSEVSFSDEEIEIDIEMSKDPQHHKKHKRRGKQKRRHHRNGSKSEVHSHISSTSTLTGSMNSLSLGSGSEVEGSPRGKTGDRKARQKRKHRARKVPISRRDHHQDSNESCHSTESFHTQSENMDVKEPKHSKKQDGGPTLLKMHKKRPQLTEDVIAKFANAKNWKPDDAMYQLYAREILSNSDTDDDLSYTDSDHGTDSCTESHSNDEQENDQTKKKRKTFFLPGNPTVAQQGDSYNALIGNLLDTYEKENLSGTHESSQQPTHKQHTMPNRSQVVKTTETTTNQTGQAGEIRRQGSDISITDTKDWGKPGISSQMADSVIERQELTPSGDIIPQLNKSQPAAGGHARKQRERAPIRNLAVRNKTGKPDTAPGYLKKNVLGTPRSTSTEISRRNSDESASTTKVQKSSHTATNYKGRRASVSLGGRTSVSQHLSKTHTTSQNQHGPDTQHPNESDLHETNQDIQKHQVQRRMSVKKNPKDSRQVLDQLQIDLKMGAEIQNDDRIQLGQVLPSTRRGTATADQISLAAGQASMKYREHQTENRPASALFGPGSGPRPKSSFTACSTARPATASKMLPPICKNGTVQPNTSTGQSKHDCSQLTQKPVMAVTPTVSKKTSGSDSSISTKSSSTSAASEQTLVDSVSQLIYNGQRYSLPDPNGISMLSFTPAFTYSLMPTLPRSHTESTKPAKSVTPSSQRDKLPVIKKAIEAKRKPTKRMSDVARLSQKIQQRLANPKPIVKYIKKLEPVDEKITSNTSKDGEIGTQKMQVDKTSQTEGSFSYSAFTTGQNENKQEALIHTNISNTTGTQTGTSLIQLTSFDSRQHGNSRMTIKVADSVIIQVQDYL